MAVVPEGFVSSPSDSVLKEGVLEKRGLYLKQWRRRVFRLHHKLLQYAEEETQDFRTMPLSDILNVELSNKELFVSYAPMTCTSSKREMRLRGEDIDTWAEMLEAARIAAHGGGRCDWADGDMLGSSEGELVPDRPCDQMAMEIGADVIDRLMQSTCFTLDELRHILCVVESICAGRPIGKNELARVLQELAGRPEPCSVGAELLYVAFDTDCSGNVDIPELITGLSVLVGKDQEKRIDMLFRSFDLDNDGFVTRSEAEQVISALFKAGGGVEGVWGGQRRDVAPVPEQEYAMFKNVLDRVFEDADASGEARVDRSSFNSCVRDFNRMVPASAIPSSKELSSWRNNLR